MSVLPPRFLDPLHGGQQPIGIERISRIPQQQEMWHIQMESRHQPVFAKPSSREDNSGAMHHEHSNPFVDKQHNELLKSLYTEIEVLKAKNRDLQLSAAMKADEKKSLGSNSPVTIPSYSGAPIGGDPLSADARRFRALEDELEKMKLNLLEEKEQNKQLSKLVDAYKRSVPLTKSKTLPGQSKDRSGSATISHSPSPRGIDLGGRESSLGGDTSKLVVEEALPFSLKPFVVHPLDGSEDRAPTLNECQAIIAQLSFHSQHQHQQLMDMKEKLKEALYSQKWTPDAYLLAKAIVNEPSSGEGAGAMLGAGAAEYVDNLRPMSADDKNKRRLPKGQKIPDAAYSVKEHGSLPALRQTLNPGVIERQKKVSSMQKKRMKSYIAAKHLENLPMQPQPPPPAPPGGSGPGPSAPSQ